MNSKTLIIYKNNILYNIVKELYSNEFDIIFSDKKEIQLLDFNKISNYLIITNDDNPDFQNKLVLNTFPIKIKNLLELINVNFLRNNYKTQSKIKIKSYTLNMNSRDLLLQDKKIFLTEREVDLILFLNNAKKPTSIDVLQKEVWGHSISLETHTVETHIYRLRKKIKDKFNDENFIISTDIGYKIN